ncbi:MAG: site-2 protease family protein [Synechococcales bacterium]|nr:site-2 protease family protein [Synechococcales bacterium]
MQSGWRIGSLFKIPLFIDPSWFLIVAWITFRDGLVWQQSHPTWSAWVAYGAGLVMAILLFGSVLLHELGHSLVAKSKGIEVNSIRLFIFGGVASIEKEPQKPADMLQIAIAGPLVSLFLWVALTALLLFIPLPSQPLAVVLGNVAALNFTLLLFNLIPGLPLDGGQMLKAIVWKFSGNYVTGAHWAAKTGLWLGWLVTLVGFADVLGLTAQLGLPQIGGIWAILIGWFMRQNAVNADRFTDVQEALLNLAAKDAMTRSYRVLDAEMNLRQFAEELVLQTSFTGQYFAASDGRYRGLVFLEQLQEVERSLWETTTLRDMAKPLTEIATVNETTPMVDLIRQMERESLNRITVLTPAGAVAGVIDRADITRAVGEKLGFPIAPAVLQQIRDTGAYPPGLQLGAIADMMTSLKIIPKATQNNES